MQVNDGVQVESAATPAMVAASAIQTLQAMRVALVAMQQLVDEQVDELREVVAAGLVV